MKRLTASMLTLLLCAGCLQSLPASEVQAADGIHTYSLVASDASWTEAFRQAQDAGGYLVRFETKEEYQYVLNQIQETGLTDTIFRIGARRDKDSQNYYWADNSNALGGVVLNSPSFWGYSEWMKGEPSFRDNGIEEQFVDLFYYQNEGRWVWNDVPDDILSVVPGYSGKLGYIVEIEDAAPSKASGSAKNAAWNEAYRSFILNQSFLNQGQTYGDEISSGNENVSFALHDIDMDRTPELIAFNGNSVYAGSQDYLYRFADGAVQYVGSLPGSNYNPMTWVSNPAFPGIFSSGAHTGGYWTDYFWLQNGRIVSEKVSESSDSPDGVEQYDPDTGELIPIETYRTENEDLYEAWIDSKNEEGFELDFYTLNDINQMGWDAFVTHYGYARP